MFDNTLGEMDGRILSDQFVFIFHIPSDQQRGTAFRNTLLLCSKQSQQFHVDTYAKKSIHLCLFVVKLISLSLLLLPPTEYTCRLQRGQWKMPPSFQRVCPMKETACG